MLKFLLLAVFISTVYCALDHKDYPPKLKEIADKLHFECKTITGAKDGEIDKARKGDFSETEELKRFATCVWLHSGIMDVHYKVDVDFLKELMPESLKEKAAEIYPKCAKEGKDSDAKEAFEKLWIATKCVYTSDPEIFIVP